jgi:adenylate kinase
LQKGLNADGAGAFRHISVSDLVREKGYHGGRDDKFDTLILDDDGEDALLDDLEDQLSGGGVILEFHSSELFPERWFDLVLVLRCVETRVLYDRLAKRGYTDVKLQENTSAEIMGICLEEAQASYAEAPVVELTSVAPSDVSANAARVLAWKAQWMTEHPTGVASGPLQSDSAAGSSNSSSSAGGSAAASSPGSALSPAGAASSVPVPAASPFTAAAAGLTGTAAWG